MYSPIFSLQNAFCFIFLTYFVPVLFTFYTQSVLKFKKNHSDAKRLRIKIDWDDVYCATLTELQSHRDAFIRITHTHILTFITPHFIVSLSLSRNFRRFWCILSFYLCSCFRIKQNNSFPWPHFLLSISLILSTIEG